MIPVYARHIIYGTIKPYIIFNPSKLRINTTALCDIKSYDVHLRMVTVVHSDKTLLAMMASRPHSRDMAKRFSAQGAAAMAESMRIRRRRATIPRSQKR